MKNKELAFVKHFEDLKNSGAAIVECTLGEDVEVEAQYTRDTWEDGRPVTKMFGRNNPVTINLSAGETVKGVSYTSKKTGLEIFDFVYGACWYSVQGPDFDAFMDAVDED